MIPLAPNWLQRLAQADQRGPGGLFCGVRPTRSRHAEERWGSAELKMPQVYKLLDERRTHEGADAIETLST